MMNIQMCTLREYQCRYLHNPKPCSPTLIFLSGALQSIETMSFYIDGLSQDFNFYIVELPGQGAAEALPASFGCDFIAECFNDFVTEQNIETFLLSAGSYSASTAYEYLKRYAYRVDRLVLTSSMKAIPESYFTSLHTCLNKKPKEKAHDFINLLTAPEEYIKSKRWRVAKKAAIRAAQTYMTRHPNSFDFNTRRLMDYHPGDLSHISTPTLLITGALDPFVTPNLTLKVAEELPHCEIVIVKEADHLMHVLEAERVLNEMSRFFTSQSVSPNTRGILARSE